MIPRAQVKVEGEAQLRKVACRHPDTGCGILVFVCNMYGVCVSVHFSVYVYYGMYGIYICGLCIMCV